jgi:hypothetical protein
MADVAPITLQAARGEARTYLGTQQTSATNATPVDISGWTIVLTVRREDNGPVLVTKSATLLSPTLGTYQVVLSASDTNLQPGTYPADLWRRDAGSERQIGYGTFTVGKSVIHG